ncbi:hypothetical protein [Chitinophaga rhizophila]|uniref:Lipoprotein n=1 Tax=Chitinophaga rhizophila TaxID=2866212 RepID=A0ABS7GGU5_9BACT|nr:hypothetical protein [Chitinophaga rhizophila]MBW8686914.1 hypothetical protein [Chitinophaga rhizophila]
MKKTQKNYFLFALMIAGGTFLAACGDGGGNHSTDSTSVGGSDNAAVTPDTAPAAEVPPGAINPGEDSARYGVNPGDSSRNRTDNR